MDRRKRKELTRRWLARLLPPLVTLVIRVLSLTLRYRIHVAEATRKIFQAGNIRIRLVEYTPGFRSDHWCPRGHVVLVLEGEFGIALKDGRRFLLPAGTSFQVGDDETNPHLAYTDKGAKVFIVD